MDHEMKCIHHVREQFYDSVMSTFMSLFCLLACFHLIFLILHPTRILITEKMKNLRLLLLHRVLIEPSSEAQQYLCKACTRFSTVIFALAQRRTCTKIKLKTDLQVIYSSISRVNVNSFSFFYFIFMIKSSK